MPLPDTAFRHVQRFGCIDRRTLGPMLTRIGENKPKHPDEPTACPEKRSSVAAVLIVIGAND